MPSCTAEVHEAVKKLFPDTDGHAGLDFLCSQYLMERGWTDLHPKHPFVLTPPKPIEQVTDEEYDCLLYLVEEWDWGYEPYQSENVNAD